MRFCSMVNSMSNSPKRKRPDCPICRGARWICEVHKSRSWGILGGMRVRGAGQPCWNCNASEVPDDPPDMPPGFKVTVRP